MWRKHTHWLLKSCLGCSDTTSACIPLERNTSCGHTRQRALGNVVSGGTAPHPTLERRTDLALSDQPFAQLHPLPSSMSPSTPPTTWHLPVKILAVPSYLILMIQVSGQIWLLRGAIPHQQIRPGLPVHHMVHALFSHSTYHSFKLSILCRIV